MTRPAISVVIPAYNEERGIVATLDRVTGWLDSHGAPYEVLVVDNASTDRTADLVAERTAGTPVRLVRNDRNRGKGYSMRRGMLDARGDLRLHCDADCAGSFQSLPKMLELIQGADVVTGSRLAAGADVGRRQPLHRRIVGRTFVELCRRALREPTHDIYCGFKLWRAAAAEAAYSRTVLEDWVFDAEVLAMARALGYRLVETGIVWADREGSRLSMPRVLLPALRDLMRARRSVRSASRAESAQIVPEPAEPRVPEPAEPRS